jgi:enterochelin esterase family protein
MYLYHAATDNETYWMQVGRANFIMDNAIADGKAKPAIVVGCFGHIGIPLGPEEGPNGEIYDEKAIEDDLMHDIMPLVEKTYRTGKTSKDRAILGHSSMGGYHAMTIGLNNPGTFGYIAGLSSGFRANQDLDANFKGMLADLEKSKKAFNLVKVQVGSDETGNVAPSQTIDRYLTAKGIPHQFIIVDGGMHSWVSWREYFRDFMCEIFKD